MSSVVFRKNQPTDRSIDRKSRISKNEERTPRCRWNAAHWCRPVQTKKKEQGNTRGEVIRRREKDRSLLSSHGLHTFASPHLTSPHLTLPYLTLPCLSFLHATIQQSCTFRLCIYTGCPRFQWSNLSSFYFMTLSKITMVYKYKSIKALFKNYDKNVEGKKAI